MQSYCLSQNILGDMFGLSQIIPWDDLLWGIVGLLHWSQLTDSKF